LPPRPAASFFIGGIKEHPRQSFPGRPGEGRFPGTLQCTYIPFFLENFICFEDVVKKYLARVEAWAKEVGGAFPLTDDELFELFFAPFGRVPADSIDMVETYLRIGLLLSQKSNDGNILAWMMVAVKERGILTDAMQKKCQEDLVNMPFNSAQFADDLTHGAFSATLNKIKDQEAMLKAKDEELKAKDEELKAMDEELKAKDEKLKIYETLDAKFSVMKKDMERDMEEKLAKALEERLKSMNIKS
jgi:hypothetical protein